MTTTPNLDLPEISASQSSKEVTHNEALMYLDCYVHLAVEDKDATSAPSSASDGDRYIVASSGAGSWASQDGNIAYWDGSAWQFFAPKVGMQAYVKDESAYYYYASSAWNALSIP